MAHKKLYCVNFVKKSIFENFEENIFKQLE